MEDDLRIAAFAEIDRWRVLHTESYPLYGEEWKKLSALSGFPRESKGYLSNIIGFYKANCALDEKRKGATDRNLAGIKKSVLEIRQQLRDFREQDALFVAAIEEVFMDKLTAGKAKERTSELLNKFDGQLWTISDYADRALKGLNKKGLKQGDALRTTILCLQLVAYHYTGSFITRQNRDRRGFDTVQFAIEVCRIADPGIENFERRVVNRLGRTPLKKDLLKVAPIIDWTLEPIEWLKSL